MIASLQLANLCLALRLCCIQRLQKLPWKDAHMHTQAQTHVCTHTNSDVCINTHREMHIHEHSHTNVSKAEFSVCCVKWTLTIIKSEPPCRSKEIPLALCWISVLKHWPLFQEVYVPLHIETVSLRVSMSLAAGGCDSVCLWTTSKYAYGGFSTLQFPEYHSSSARWRCLEPCDALPSPCGEQSFRKLLKDAKPGTPWAWWTVSCFLSLTQESSVFYLLLGNRWARKVNSQTLPSS